MKTHTWNKGCVLLPLLIILGILFSSVSIVAAEPNQRPAVSFSDTYDYFIDQYPRLKDKAHVFHTAEYYQFEYLLQQPGTYIFLIGGAWSDSTQAVLPLINAVAKEYGITAIYNFDPKLDGNTLDIQASNTPYTKLYTSLVRDYLLNLTVADPEQQVTDTDALSYSKIESPYLFVYNKDHKNGETPAPILSYFEESPVWEDFTKQDGSLDQEAVAGYEARLRSAFDRAATEENGRKILSHSVLTDSDYIKDVINTRYQTAYGNNSSRNLYRPFDTEEDVVYEVVTLSELNGILSSEGNYAILFGGLWCHNTWAVVGLIDAYAKKYNIDKIYFYDTVLDSSGSGSSTQTRNSNRELTPLYTDLVKQYLTNIFTINDAGYLNTLSKGNYTTEEEKLALRTSGSNSIYYTNSQEETVWASRLQLPFFFTYNKDHLDAQQKPAPILGYVEQMTDLWLIQPESAAYTNYLEGYTRAYSNSSYTSYHPGLKETLHVWARSFLDSLIQKGRAVEAASYTAASYQNLHSALEQAELAQGEEILSAYADLELAFQQLRPKSQGGQGNTEEEQNGNHSENGGTPNKETPIPQTGDVALPEAVIGILLLSGIGLAGLKYRKKRDSDEPV